MPRLGPADHRSDTGLVSRILKGGRVALRAEGRLLRLTMRMVSSILSVSVPSGLEKILPSFIVRTTFKAEILEAKHGDLAIQFREGRSSEFEDGLTQRLGRPPSSKPSMQVPTVSFQETFR